MIFQPSGGAGSGEGLTVYNGSFLGTRTFETPVKLVFVSYLYSYIDIPLWYIISPGGSKVVFGIENATWPPVEIDRVSLSADGKTLSSRNNNPFSYCAIG